MKKLALTIAIVLGLGITTFAQGGYYGQEEVKEESGLFGMGVSFFNRNGNFTLLPGYTEYAQEDTEEDCYDYGVNYYYFGDNGIFGLGTGLFKNRGNRGGEPGLPNFNGEENGDAPLGSGIAVLMGLGAAYLVAKKRKND